MIAETIFGAILTCTPVTIVNDVDITSNLKTTQDMNTLIKAKKRCGEIYKDAPCVETLYIKTDSWGDRMYSVICRAKDYKKESVWLNRRSRK